MTDVDETNSTDAAVPTGHQPSPAVTREDAEKIVQLAFERTAAAHESGTPAAQVHAGELLQEAVDDARDVGVGWERIGTILGIARGNAYHRHRKRPQ